MTIRTFCRVRSVREAGPDIRVLKMSAPGISTMVRPGQFLNIRTSDTYIPLLRRPFSVYHRDGEDLSIIFNIVGAGTRILAAMGEGTELDVIGPLGNAFGVADDFDEALLVAGGLGVAPLPVLTEALRERGKTVATFLGARTAPQIVTTHLENVSVATDDGSAGLRGTVVDLLGSWLGPATDRRRKIFSCGPTPMLRALSAFAAERGIPCEISLESPMACGIGICQGCPVEVRNGPRKYALVCKDGTVFDSANVVL